jgi:hypothetical protein
VEDGTRQSGGLFAQVLVDSGIPGAMKALAEELASQYVLVYRTPAGSPGRKINLSTSRQGVKLRANSEPARAR